MEPGNSVTGAPAGSAYFWLSCFSAAESYFQSEFTCIPTEVVSAVEKQLSQNRRNLQARR